MEMGKYHEGLVNSSKVVSEIDDSTTVAQIDEDSENDNTGIGRTYECSYCKRGFTNAQALGGHMNIHRKDKAKAKQQQQQQQQQQQNYFSSPAISYKRDELFSSNYTTNPSNLVSQMNIYGPNNFYQYYPFPNPNNSYSITSSHQPSIYGSSNEFSSGRTRLFGLYEEQLGADLSLRMGSSSSTTTASNRLYQGDHHENNRPEDKYSAIDLELRLGYDP